MEHTFQYWTWERAANVDAKATMAVWTITIVDGFPKSNIRGIEVRESWSFGLWLSENTSKYR